MYNKKVLSTAVSKLGSAKAPTKKRDKVYTNKEALSPFVSSEGFKQGPPPAGTNYRIPGDTLYNPTPYSIEAVSDNGIRKTLNPNDTTNVQFPGATYVDEYQMGGEDYYEDELTDDEIEELRRGGYIVEDISIPSVGGYKKGGALLTKKVTCKNCGWSWDAADGGNDLTTCHKCGGKGLIHAQTGGPLPKAQLGKNKVTLEASPFSLNANQAQLASNVYGEYDPEFLIGASMPIGGSRDPRIANSLSLTAGLPLNGTAVPSINAGYKFRYRPSSMNAGAFAPTTQLDVGAGWDPTQGLNFQAKANPRWEFANRRADAYLKHNWPVGAWRGYAGPSGGLNLRQNSFVPGLAGYGTQEKTAGNINLFYGAEAGIEGRPFKKTPLRVGLDAGLLMNLAKKQAEESFNPETDFGKSATGFTPMLKAKVVYPLGTAYPKKKEASEEKVRLDAARANDKNYQVDAPTITGPGVDWDYENRPEQSGVPVGYLPGYEPETGRQLTEEELMQRYSPRLAKGGNLPIAQTGQQIYKYADRPEARYKKDDKGNWLINLPSTNGQFVPINDASGKRAGELNEKATLDPSQFRRQYEPMTDVKPQVVENTAIPNAPKADPTLIDRAVQQKQAERAIVGEKIRANPLLTEDQKLEIITSPQKLDENVHLAYEKGPDEVKAYTPDKPQDFWDKAGDVVSNPMTSLGFLMRGEAIPDYMQRDMDRGTFGYYSNGELHTERNPLDFAVADMTGLSLVNDARSTYKGLSEGDYTQAGLGLLSFIPGFGEARKAVNAIDATADANKAMRIAENTQDLSQKTSPLVREQIMREVPIEAPYFNRSAVNPNYAYPMTKGRTVSYDETIDLIEDMHNTYPTYQQSGYPIYFHGSTSASIPGIVNNEGILPLGELMNTGQVPFTGELAYGVNGINQGHTSTAFIRTPESALSYALNQSGKGRVDVEGELNRWFTERRPNFEQIPGMPKAEFYDDLYNKRLTQWNALTDQEKALLNENYPVLYGIKPKTGNVEGANRFRVPITDIADETAIAGKIGMDEIPSMFVPRTHVESLQKFLGDRTKVLPMDDFIKNQRIPYKAKQSADRWSELGYDLNYGLGGVATALNHFRKGGEKKYSRSLSAKNRLFVENKLTKKQKSKKKKIFDPKAKYFQDGGTNQVECDDDGRCYETDQAQELLDKTHKTIGTALNMDRYIAEQVWNGAPANKEWQKLGVRTADQITGDPNAFACANSATRGYEACDPQAVNDADTLSNARMKSAVAAGRTPFRKVATHKDNDFLYGNDLKPGQLISFMGDGTNHMIKYYGDNFNGDQRAFMQSNGNVDDWSFMTDAGWLPNVPSTVYEYAPHYDEIQALEEQARTNPTYVPGTSSVGTLPIRQPASLPIAESERQLPAVAGDLGMRKVGGVPELPLNQNRQVLRDWVYGQSIGMLQEDDGGYMDLDLSDEEIQRMKDLGYYVEEY